MPPPARPDPPAPVDVYPPANTTPFDTASGSRVVIGSSIVLFGWAMLNESTTAEAEVDLWDGLDIEGTLMFPVTLLPQESVREWYGDRGLLVRVGVFAQAVIGGVKGSVWWLPPSRGSG